MSGIALIWALVALTLLAFAMVRAIARGQDGMGRIAASIVLMGASWSAGILIGIKTGYV